MKKYISCVVLLILSIVILTGGVAIVEAGTEIFDSYYEQDLHLTKEGSPYTLIGNGLYITPDHTLTIDPGVTVLFPESSSLYMDHSNLVIGSSTSSEKVTLKSSSDTVPWSGIYIDHSNADIHGIEIINMRTALFNDSGTVSIKNLTINNTKDFSQNGIYSSEGSLTIASSTITGFTNVGIFLDSTKGSISNSIISGNRRGIFYDGNIPGNFSGSGNSFINNDVDIYNTNEITTLDFRGNDWGTGGAPKVGSIIGKVTTGYEDSPKCCSSIVFIPGIQASRLYKDLNQLWEPNIYTDVDKLYLDENGNSLDPDVVIGEIIDKTNVAGPIFSKKIYQSFIENMDALVSAGNINSWQPFPYDWRLRLSSRIDFMVSEIQKMATTSKTRKVTIITHSNGGLVAKFLINRLKSEGKENLIDNFIMVAAPQLGTPQAISGLLHGDEAALVGGILLNKQNARMWGEDMPGAYNLLPNTKYLETVDAPPILFDVSLNQINDWREFYGESVTTVEELKKFLLGDEGRTKPGYYDLAMPNILNTTLVDEAKAVHAENTYFNVGTSTKIYQIAGWGKSTTSGTKYFATKHCGFDNFCIGNSGLGLDHENVHTFDGDGTVITPSATAMKDSSTTYFVDIKSVNKGFGKNYDHSSILEVPAVLDLVNNIVLGTSTGPIKYITNEKPESVSSDNLKISVFSPVNVHAYDINSNHTGVIANPDKSSDIKLVEENIPNSFYEEVGEGKYFVLQNPEEKTDIHIQGTGVGVFTLKIENTDDGKLTITEFTDIPTTDLTKVKIDFTTSAASTTLLLDSDGNGKTDFVVTPSLEPDPILYLNIFKQTIASFKLKPAIEKILFNKIDKVIKFLSKDKQKIAVKKLVILNKKIMNKNWKVKRITENDRIEIIKIINEILDTF